MEWADFGGIKHGESQGTGARAEVAGVDGDRRYAQPYPPGILTHGLHELFRRAVRCGRGGCALGGFSGFSGFSVLELRGGIRGGLLGLHAAARIDGDDQRAQQNQHWCGKFKDTRVEFEQQKRTGHPAECADDHIRNGAYRLAFEFFARTHHATDARADHANGVRSVCQYRRNAEREQGRV